MLLAKRKEYACHSQSQHSTWSCTSLSPIIEQMDTFTTRIRPALLHQERITDEYSLDEQDSCDSLDSQGSTDALLLPAQTVLPSCCETNQLPSCGDPFDLTVPAPLKRVPSVTVRRRRSSVLNFATDVFQNPLVSLLSVFCML